MIQALATMWDWQGNQNSGTQYIMAISLLFFSLGVVIIGYALNISGYATANLFIFAIMAVSLVCLWLYPVFGLPRCNQNAITDDITGQYWLLLAHIIIWIAAILVGMGILSIQKHPLFFWMLIPAITIVTLATFTWERNSSWAKPLIYWSAVGITAILFAVTIFNSIPSEIKDASKAAIAGIHFPSPSATLPAPAKKMSSSKPAPQQIAKPAPIPVTQAVFRPAPAPPPKPEICSHSEGILKWGDKDYPTWIKVQIECKNETIVLHGPRSSFYITDNKWLEGSVGGYLSMQPTSSGNLLAEGTMETSIDPAMPIWLEKIFP